jgi:hypothetical protein
MASYVTLWGSNDNNQLDPPFKLLKSVNNLNLESGGFDSFKTSVGYNHTVSFLKPFNAAQYALTGWGNNSYGQVSFGDKNFYYKDCEAGIETTYLLDIDGRIHGFGKDLIFTTLFDATGAILNWDFYYADLNKWPQGYLFYPKDFVKISPGSGYLLAIDKSGKITGWGGGYTESFNVVNHSKFNQINTIGKVLDVSAGFNHALVLFSGGLISGWGDNSSGQLDFPDQIFNSGVKISTKANYNLALGFQSPLITGANGDSDAVFKVKNIGFFDQSSQVTGIHIQYSLDRKDWYSYVVDDDFEYKESSLLTGASLPTDDLNYYVRLVEFYDNLIQNTGSTSIYNPAQEKFDLWSDYRVFGWGTGDPNMAQIPNILNNQRILDISAGYKTNLVLTDIPLSTGSPNLNPSSIPQEPVEVICDKLFFDDEVEDVGEPPPPPPPPPPEPGEEVTVNITFRVDMNNEIDSDNFNPSTEAVSVVPENNDAFIETDLEEVVGSPGVYQAVVSVTAAQNSSVYYYYNIVRLSSDTIEDITRTLVMPSTNTVLSTVLFNVP